MIQARSCKSRLKLRKISEISWWICFKVAVDASGVSRRYAFVQYEKEEEAEKAIDVMDQIKILVSSTLNCPVDYAAVLRNRFRFRLLTSYGSGSDSGSGFPVWF